MRNIAVALVLAGFCASLSGCAVVSVVDAGVSAASTVVGTTADVVGAAADTVTGVGGLSSLDSMLSYLKIRSTAET